MATTSSSHRSAPPGGIYTPLVTFFLPDGSFDFPAIEAHAIRIARGGVAGLVIQGSNGEAVHLDREERLELVRFIRSALDKAGHSYLPLIVGAGAQSLRETVRLCSDAKAANGDYVLILPPSYWPTAMTAPVLIEYFKQVANESPLPVLIYNFPMVANGINIDSDTMLQLAKHPNIVGCKLTCGRICSHTSPEIFACMSGKAEFALHGFVGGAKGCIAALVNLAPKAHVALYNAWTSGNLAEAQNIQRLLSDADLAQSKLGVSGLKLAVSDYFGYGSGIARRPLPDGDQAKLAAQRGILDELIAYENSL